jgi:hypothetical protein
MPPNQVAAETNPRKRLREQVMLKNVTMVLVVAAAFGGCANLDERGNEVVGGAVGGAAGAAIGREVGGPDGAVLGAGTGAAIGTAVGQRNSRPADAQPVTVQEPVVYREGERRHEAGDDDRDEHHDRGHHYGRDRDREHDRGHDDD